MPGQIKTGSVHHVVLTVTELDRSVRFYTELLGFQTAADLGRRVLLSNGSVILGVGLSPEPGREVPGDCFDENRVGLDHVSLSVAGLEDLHEATRLLDERKVPRGEIKDLRDPFGIYVLAFRDPDNIQIELMAPAA